MVKPDHSKTRPFEFDFEGGREIAMWTAMKLTGELECKNWHENSKERKENKELVAAMLLIVLNPISC